MISFHKNKIINKKIKKKMKIQYYHSSSFFIISKNFAIKDLLGKE
jgi:hypothetical protein